MPDPKRALTIRRVQVGGKELPPDTLLWVHGKHGDYLEVEYGDRRGRISPTAVVSYPVAGPSLTELKLLDSCFDLPDTAFQVEHQSREHLFELLRCRAHGRRFLRDVRGELAMYSALTLLEDNEEGAPDEIWARYHWKSHSWLMLEGRTR